MDEDNSHDGKRSLQGDEEGEEDQDDVYDDEPEQDKLSRTSHCYIHTKSSAKMTNSEV